VGTQNLLRKAQRGRRIAIEELFRRELAPLRRWAFANVPAAIRRGGDTDDFVQRALLRTLRRLPHLRLADDGTLQPYLRRVVMNLVRDHGRAQARQPETRPLQDWDHPIMRSPADAMIGAERYARYRAAVRKLSPRARVALQGRIERGLDYAAVARLAQCASPAAARAMVGRALERVMKDMRAGETPGARRPRG